MNDQARIIMSRRARAAIRAEVEAGRTPSQWFQLEQQRNFAVNEIPIGVTNAQDTSRQRSPNLWGPDSWSKITTSPAFGSFIGDDFSPVATPSNVTPAIGVLGQWAMWGAAGTTITDGVEEGGVVKINGTTANKSFILTSNAGTFRMVGQNTFGTTAYPLVGRRFWMEMRIALGSVAASQQGVFFGLADNTGSQINSSDTTIFASGGNTLTTTKNIIGLVNRTTTGPADWSVVYQPAAGTAVYPTGLTTLVNTVTGANMVAYAAGSTSATAASTGLGQGTNFVKIGMLYNPASTVPLLQAPTTCPSGQTAGTKYRPTIKFFVNGVPAPAFLNPTILQAATFPTNCVYSPVFNYMNIAGGTAPVYLDWIYMAQEASF